MFKELGIVVEPQAEYTKEQNSLTERAGQTLVVRGRAIRINAGLPIEVSNECLMLAVSAQLHSNGGSRLAHAI